MKKEGSVIKEGCYSLIYSSVNKKAYFFSGEDEFINMEKKMALAGHDKIFYIQVLVCRKGENIGDTNTILRGGGL